MKTNHHHISLPVLDSVSHVEALSRFVCLHREQVRAAVEDWGHLMGKVPGWKHPCHFSDDTEETARWIFLLDVLNHCFWAGRGEELWRIRYGGEEYSGYWGLAAALKRALERGYPLTDAAFLSRMTMRELESILAGTGTIPLLEARLANVREAGRILIARWRGDIVHLIEQAQESAVQLVWHVVESFPSFRDEAQYKGGRIFFWKRAQIFAADLSAAYGGEGLGCFHDLRRLTAFADYKLPQVLRQLGILCYAPCLAAKVDGLEELKPGSEEEVEIRALTILAVEECRKAFIGLGSPVTSTQVDSWLWHLGQHERFRQKPYHRSRTIFY